MTTADTLTVVKNTLINPVPIVNTALFLGMSESDWDLAMKVMIGFASFIWTCAKIYLEIRKFHNKKDI
jgi:hypothetical protein